MERQINKWGTLVLVVAALGSSAAACKKSTPTTDDAAVVHVDSSTGAHDSGPMGAVDSGPGGSDSGPATMDSGPAVGGACTNAADGPLLSMTFDAGMNGGGSPGDVAAICGRSCLTSTSDTCVRDCVHNTTGLSNGCSDCFGGTVSCVIMNCIGPCLADSSSPGCIACECGSNAAHDDCIADFDTCSGLTTHSDNCAIPDAGPPTDAGHDAGATSDAGHDGGPPT